MPMSWKLQLPQQSAPAKQSFEDNCVPKLELGNEGVREILAVGNYAAFW